LSWSYIRFDRSKVTNNITISQAKRDNIFIKIITGILASNKITLLLCITVQAVLAFRWHFEASFNRNKRTDWPGCLDQLPGHDPIQSLAYVGY
jgi:hypothetical protein